MLEYMIASSGGLIPSKYNLDLDVKVDLPGATTHGVGGGYQGSRREVNETITQLQNMEIGTARKASM